MLFFCHLPSLPPLLSDSFARETSSDIQKKPSRTVHQENVLVRKKQEIIWIWKKGILPELCSTASPLGPTMVISPSGSSSCLLFLPHHFFQFHQLLCLQYTLEGRSSKRSVSYMRGSHCIPFIDGMQHPSGPRWPCDKVHTNPDNFWQGRMPFWIFSTILDIWVLFVRGKWF